MDSFYSYLPIMNLFFAIVLVRGAHKENRGCFSAFIIFTAIFMLLHVLMFSTTLVYAVMLRKIAHESQPLYILLGVCLPKIVLDIINITAAGAYKMQMRENKEYHKA
ncbi:uncharacterized protein LOC142977406 [Anticarsia gemmatalis]|uniref:uncharacterized protein LOC142977406 n=1 Tax=Anticarsia gemmatalis TaxID=129554 RepID=UPI003F7584F2